MKPQNESKMIRSFGLFVGLVLVAIGTYLTIRSQQPRYALFGIGAYFLAGAMLFQPMLRPIFVVWMKIASALAWFNTRLLLGIVYYLVFTPVRLVQRLGGRVALRLRRRAETSYWAPKAQPIGGKSSYFRQF
jgi:hypothetical protein